MPCRKWIEDLRDWDNAEQWVKAQQALVVSIDDCAGAVAEVLRTGDETLAGYVAGSLGGVEVLPMCTVQAMIDRLHASASEDLNFMDNACLTLARQSDAVVSMAKGALVALVARGISTSSWYPLCERLGPALLPDLLPLLASEAEPVRAVTLVAILRCKGSSTEATELVRGLVGDKSLRVRAEAARLLIRWESDVPRQLERLRRWLAEASGDDKLDVLWRMRGLGPRAEVLRPDLRALLEQSRDDERLKEEIEDTLDELVEDP